MEVGYPYSGKEGRTVSLKAKLSARGIREASYLKGRFVEAIRETLVRVGRFG